MKKSIAKKHKDCDLSIRWKLFKDRPTPTAGLYCIKHNQFMDWLPDDVAYKLIDENKIPVHEWVEKKSKRVKIAP
jgi:uncharacterized cysteine cluster protein YcgN (CxxCxxCC family)